MKSRIYQGKVMHARHHPVRHSWVFPFYFYAIDLEELEDLDRTVKGFGYNRWKPVCLFDRDYLRGQEDFRNALSEYIDTSDIHRIVLITMARFMTKVFNPVSFYYCLLNDGSPKCMVAEVNNTFGERHLYIMDTTGSFPITCDSSKQFHVSPFNNMQGHYAFSFSAPADELNIGIRLIRDGETVLDAAMWGTGKPLTTTNLWSTLLRHPLTAALTMPRILWQAALLHYKKRLPVFKKPAPISSMTIKERV